MNIGVILAAGASERFKSPVHKQYLKLNGKEVIYYSIKAMRDTHCFDKIIAVVDKDEFIAGYISKKYDILCIEGGETRNKSIKKALNYIKDNFSCKYVVFHDCSRPIIHSSIFEKLLEQIKYYNGVALCSNISDSLVLAENNSFVNRNDYMLIRTPEAFKFSIIFNDFDGNKADTAIINQLYDKTKVFLLHNNSLNFKITYPEDLFLAEQFMRINYEHTDSNIISCKNIGKVLLLGGSGGVGANISSYFASNSITYFAPSHKELDLALLTVENIEKICPFVPDVIINAAATYENDEAGLIETFDNIFNVNLRANLVLIEYAKKLNKKVNIVVMSSSSSIMGRENLTNYSASKAALNSVVESQGEYLAKQNIYINAVIPEKIDTELINKLHKISIDKRELLSVQEVINVIMKLAQAKNGGQLIHIRKGL